MDFQKNVFIEKEEAIKVFLIFNFFAILRILKDETIFSSKAFFGIWWQYFTPDIAAK